MTSTKEKPAPIIFGDESLSDCTLVVGNQDFKIHKMTLACRSEVFKAMFYRGLQEGKETRIEIIDVSAKTFRRFLELIYTSKLSDPEFLLFPYREGRMHKIVELKENDTDENTEDVDYADVDYTESYGKYFHNFWKNTTELLNIADRFNLDSMVKNYLEKIIDTLFECRNNECHVCFNYEALGIIYKVHNGLTSGWYNLSVYLEFMKYAGQAPFPCSISIERLTSLQDSAAINGKESKLTISRK